MTLAAEKEYAHVRASAGAADHDRDLVHELSKRLDALWRYDQYLANAEGHRRLQELWRELKRHETVTVGQLKQMIAEEVRKGCF